MKPELINNSLQPPEKAELAFDEFTEKAIDFVKKNIPIAHVYDLYEHDREVALNFFKWMVKYTADWGAKKIFVSDKKYPMRMTIEEIWEIYCTETKK